MPSYAVTGISRGLGVRSSNRFLSPAHACVSFQLGFVRALSANPANTVFAIVRSLSSADQLQDLVRSHKHDNIHIIEADNTDIQSIKVWTTVPYFLQHLLMAHIICSDSGTEDFRYYWWQIGRSYQQRCSYGVRALFADPRCIVGHQYSCHLFHWQINKLFVQPK